MQKLWRDKVSKYQKAEDSICKKQKNYVTMSR